MDVFSFWTGPVSWVERVSAASMAAHGHKLALFTYDVEALRRSGIAADVRDARDVFKDDTTNELIAQRPDYWSDIFRVEGLALGLGAWVDMDLIFLKSLPASDYLIGRNGRSFNNAILKFPVGSPALTEYLALCRTRPLPRVAPYWSWDKRYRAHFDIARKRLMGRRLPPPQLGGGALAYLSDRHNLQPWLSDEKVFYPVQVRDMDVFFATPDKLAAFLTPETVTVHLWNRQFTNKFGRRMPPGGSWLAKVISDYDAREAA
jgi:hypothetical protein